MFVFRWSLFGKSFHAGTEHLAACLSRGLSEGSAELSVGTSAQFISAYSKLYFCRPRGYSLFSKLYDGAECL